MKNDIRPALPHSPVIAALHLPPFPGSGHPQAKSIAEIRDHALRNTEAALNAGLRALYLQDLGDYPVAPAVQPHITAGVAAVGAALRQAFPELTLGVCLMSHGAREPLAVAQAIGASFVRLKVYVGAVVKAEGIQQGCAYEAVRYRKEIAAEEIAIFADIHDRTATPLGQPDLAEEAHQAAVYGRADGLVLTGRSFQESLAMLKTVRDAGIQVPLLLGGGVRADNLPQALSAADGVIVSSAFKAKSGFSAETIQADWVPEKMAAFMQALPPSA